MKTKILLGSIGAVAILILVSLTNVVGVHSASSSSVTPSPLFTIRTQKARNPESTSLVTSHYLGKGQHTVSFPLSANKTVLLQLVLDRITHMDETTFENFISMIIHQKNQNTKPNTIDSQKLIAALFKLRNNHVAQPNQNIERNEKTNVPHVTDEVDGLIGDFLLYILFYIYLVSGIIFASVLQFLVGIECGHSFFTGCETCPEFKGQVQRYLNDLVQ